MTWTRSYKIKFQRSVTMLCQKMSSDLFTNLIGRIQNFFTGSGPGRGGGGELRGGTSHLTAPGSIWTLPVFFKLDYLTVALQGPKNKKIEVHLIQPPNLWPLKWPS